ncbi:MAG: ABC transporter permease [Bacteroidales bacterium]|nr:ABC transporter permease [Bacteroidales bacterium]
MNKYGELIANYVRLAFRRMIRQPSYALINLVGLSTGLMVFLLIMTYIVREYDYDRCWKDYEKIYRINATLDFNGRVDHFAMSSYNIVQSMKHDFPEVEAATMILRTSSSDDQTGITVWIDDLMYELRSFTYADADFFKVFDFPFVEGNAENALKEPKSIVINTVTAHQFFGDKPALGKMLRINKTTFVVTGVIDRSEIHTHLQFDALASLNTYPASTIEQFTNDWFWLIGYTYVKFGNKTDAEHFAAKLDWLAKETIQPWIKQVNVDGSIHLHHEPLTHIHFNNKLQYDSSSNTNKNFVNLFGFIAVFLLLIASINYMNLATARSMKRAREIGIRKVAGAHRTQLIMQFLGESMVLSLIAFLIALSLAELSLPYFNNLIGLNLSLSALFFSESLLPLIILIMAILLLGMLSGLFPAFVLSSFSPIQVLRPGINPGNTHMFSSGNLRKILVVLQFIISIGMIISTLVVSKQLTFMQNAPKGFQSEQVMVIHFPIDTSLFANKEVIRHQILEVPEVQQVSLSQSLPGYKSGRLMFFVGDTVKPEVHTINLYVVDHEFFDLLKIKLIEGRLFSKEYPNDASTAFVVNKAAADYLGYPNPLEVEMNCGMGVQGKIVGVVDNFHYSSMHQPIEPLVFILVNKRADYLAVKLNSRNMSETVARIGDIWQKFDSKHFFHYTFLDDRFAQQYRHEQQMLSLFGYFSLLVILISCLGLYGLSAFSIEQRTREIGIRKVLGASPRHTLMLILRGFMTLVLIAGLISLPVVYYLMTEWLNGFAFRVGLNPLWFLGGFFIAMLIAFATIMIQATKALKANPVDALKYE